VVLNAIHLKKMADTVQLTSLCGLNDEALSAVLTSMAGAELIMSMDSGHLLLPDGTAAVLRHYHDTYAAIRSDPELSDWYLRFETLNVRFIAVLTSWQQVGGDDLIFKALEIVEQLCGALDDILSLVPRYAEYQRRFEAALDAIDNGDTDLLCNPRRDSAHNIWFEFHEDILGVLGKPRDTTS